jgi:hypothetical protein
VRKFLENLKLFFYGALFKGSTEKLEARAAALNEDLLTIILSDRVGIPNPLYYHTVELLPYLHRELHSWRNTSKESILGRAFGEVGEP